MSESQQEKSRNLLELAYKSLDYWGLEGSLSLIKERENSVYAFQNGDQRYALRVHRQGYHSDKSLASEHLWVRALAETGLSVPEAVPTKEGADFVTVSTDKVKVPRQVDLMVWVEGKQIGSVEEGLGDNVEETRKIYLTMGRVAAQFHNQAVIWPMPADFERHSWNLEGLLGEEPFWGRFWDLKSLTDEQRFMLIKARTDLTHDLREYGQTTDNYSLIHADFAPENFLIDGDRVQVIDFDDAGFGWHMFELATALYFIQDDPNYELAKDALIEGYREYRDLSDADLLELPMFLAARSLTYLGWVHQRSDSSLSAELTPMLVDLCCSTLKQYFEYRSG